MVVQWFLAEIPKGQPKIECSEVSPFLILETPLVDDSLRTQNLRVASLTSLSRLFLFMFCSTEGGVSKMDFGKKSGLSKEMGLQVDVSSAVICTW